MGERALLPGLLRGHEVALSRHAPDFLRAGSALGSPLGDRGVSRTPIRLVPATDGRIRVLRERSTTTVALAGAAGDTFELEPLAPGAGVPIVLADRLVLVLHLLDDEAENAEDLGMIGRGAGIQRVRRSIAQVADVAVPVLIRGETGTGKELVARALHARGPRARGPFVAVNLGALPRDLAAAELFGAVKGAYTGATGDREGYFRAAAGGTLFLDEIGEASPEVQVMLLRVLESGELYPVGGSRPIATDVRLIAATDARLEAAIDDGRFKAPLLHRLAGHEVHLPPLRERPEDIGLLFHRFARDELAAIGELDQLASRATDREPWMPPDVALALLRHRWPGNVRQLRNITRQLVIASRGRASLQLEPRLAAELQSGAPPSSETRTPAVSTASTGSGPRRRAALLGEDEVVAALRASAWDLQAAADRLGISRPSMYALIERFPSIRTAGDVSADEIARCHANCDGDLDRMATTLEVSRRALQRRVKELGLALGPPDDGHVS